MQIELPDVCYETERLETVFAMTSVGQYTDNTARLARVLEQDYVLLDGGSATQMVRLGFQNIESDPLWSARLLKTHPDAVKQAYTEFSSLTFSLLEANRDALKNCVSAYSSREKAGSQVLDTASYQASVGGFVQHLGVDEAAARDLIGQSVVLAREACTEEGVDAVVAGCVGPYGASQHDCSEYKGKYVEKMTKEELKNWHRPRVSALLEYGADMLALDTIPALKEAEALVDLLTEFPAARAWVSFSCQDSIYTCHGETFAEAVQAVVQSDQVVVVGLNCTSPEYVCGLLDSIQHLHLQKPVVIKPNIAEKFVTGTGWVETTGRPSLEAQTRLWMDRGATWIGGCCKVYPEDISRMKVVIDNVRKQKNMS